MSDSSDEHKNLKQGAMRHSCASETDEILDEEVRNSVEHLHGPTEVFCNPNEIVLVSLVRDGQTWVRPFLEYHLSLGVKHITLLDSGSEDETVNIVKEYDHVTLLRMTLPFKSHKHAARRYLINRFGKGHWALYLDIDEMFDYPYSDIFDFETLIEYLSHKSYTALATQTLDVFPEKPLLSAAEIQDEPLSETHKYYDLSNIRREEYSQYRHVDNILSNPEIKVLRGGIQMTISGHPAVLTRHPLMFVDKEIVPMGNSVHWPNRARIADFTGVIFHYRFASDLQERAARFAREEGHGGNPYKYKQYLRILEETPDLQIKQETSEELSSVNDLVDKDFLTVSESYMKWMDRKEEERLAPETLRKRPFRLAEAFSKARGRKRDQTQAAHQARLRAQTLENEVQEEREKARRIEQRNAQLESALQEVRNSRAWRILGNVARVKNILFGGRKGI